MSDASDTPDGYAVVADLIALITSPTDASKRLAELKALLAATAKAQSRLDSEKATNDRTAAAVEADMIAREAAVRKREVVVAVAEKDLAAREKIIADARPPRYSFDPNFGPGSMGPGGITREPEHG